MRAYVIIATKGRPREVTELLGWLDCQTLLPVAIIVVGAEAADIDGLADCPGPGKANRIIVTTDMAGLCLQRNAGFDCIKSLENANPSDSGYFVTFFDDDFRPADDWLKHCAELLDNQPDVVAVTGHVLGDGVHGHPLTSDQARSYIEGRLKPDNHWASGERQVEFQAMYGCNMAFRDRVVMHCRFDEELPLYGWQEDRDFTSQARHYGRTVYTPECKGVHLGISTGRVSGIRFGYSQIANPLYLIGKGTMRRALGAKFVMRHLLANSTRLLHQNSRVDYAGRLKGNLLAISDVVRGRCHPQRVIKL
jgi:hypothetical protein